MISSFTFTASILLLAGTTTLPQTDPNLHDPLDVLRRIELAWQEQESMLVSGQIDLTRYWFVDETQQMNIDDVKNALKLGPQFDVDALKQGSLPEGFPQSTVGSAEWGGAVRVVFEGEKVKNTVSVPMDPKTHGIDKYEQTIIFDGVQQIAYDSDNSQATVYPKGERGLQMINMNTFVYHPKMTVGTARLEEVDGALCRIQNDLYDILVDKDSGFVHKATVRDREGGVKAEVWQFGEEAVLGGSLFFPSTQVRINMGDKNVRMVTIYKINSKELNIPVEQAAFRSSAPVSPHRDHAVILDMRDGTPQFHSSKQDVEDVLGYINTANRQDKTQTSVFRSWLMRLNLIGVGVAAVVFGVIGLRRFKNQKRTDEQNKA